MRVSEATPWRRKHNEGGGRTENRVMYVTSKLPNRGA